MTRRAKGLLPALAAFTIWGLAPLYFKLLGAASAMEIVSHRIIWSALLLAAVLAFRHGFGVLRSVARDGKLAALLALTTALTATNWLLFVWAINTGQVLEASPGYFIAPLINVLFGRLFLGERLRPWQAAAVGLATCGVLWRVWHLGSLPWVALALSTTFALYGLLRKRAPVAALDGLFVETLMALLPALAFVVWLMQTDASHFGPSPGSMALLAGTGITTAIPLWLFTVGARQLRLTTLGFCQYTAPSLQFLLAVVVFGEPFNHVALVGFAFIWGGLALFSLDALAGAGAAGERGL